MYASYSGVNNERACRVKRQALFYYGGVVCNGVTERKNVKRCTKMR